MKGKRLVHTGLATALVLALLAGLALAQQPAGSPLIAAFTYQGRLNSSDVPYTGACDFQFGLWDALTGGTQVGATQTIPNVGLADGYFTVLLDWGADKFFGEQRWLEIYVRCPAGGGSYTPLTPRQQLTASPQALFTLNAPWPGLIGVPPGFADGVDNDTTYGAGMGLILTDTIFTADTSVMQQRVIGACGTGFAIREVKQDGSVTCEPVGSGGGDAWLLTGNSGTTPGTNFVGTTDNAALVFKVNNERALRLESTPGSPNVIGGYIGNWAYSGVYGASIGGGGDSTGANVVTDLYGTVGGGAGNQAGDAAGTIDDELYTTVGGGYGNTAGGNNSTVGGGDSNEASGPWATIGGGIDNSASGYYSTVGGGIANIASGSDATVGGGTANTASDQHSTVGGGTGNTASGLWATVGGGSNNAASGDDATVGGGTGNTASLEYATVGGGGYNNASLWYATVGGGDSNTASGNWSTVPGGLQNVALGFYSFAAGRRAKAYQDGCFVWGDSTDADVTCDYANRWVARASGGVYFYTNAGFTSGSYLAAGGSSWNSVSDRATKENFSPADGQAILETLASLPVQEYNLISQDDSIRHIGLVAQNFARFGYGESDKAINLEDADGVAMAAIQALYAENQELKAQVADLNARLTVVEQAAQCPGLSCREGGQPAQGESRVPVPWLLVGGLVVAGGGVAAGLRHKPGGAAMNGKSIPRAPSALLVIAVLLLLAAVPVLAQSGGGYDLTWSTVDGGGGTFSTGGGYSLGGTAGQPDAGLASGGTYTLGGGFWSGGAAVAGYRVYLPLVVRNY